MKNIAPSSSAANIRVENFLTARRAEFALEIGQFFSRENIVESENASPEPALAQLFLLEKQSPLPEILKKMARQKSAGKRVVLVWADDEPPAARTRWELLASEADELLEWRGCEKCPAILAARLSRWTRVEQLLAHPFFAENMVGQSPAWRSLLRSLLETAVFSQSPVLILGESGTGKESAARLIHQFDIRPVKEKLVLLDCASVAPELSGSEFFGHEKGAFTNAMNSRMGAFEEGHHGTIFLDEIGELPVRLQGELLRVLQEGTFKPLGGNTWKRTEFRLVSATNRDLAGAVGAQQFRHDLFHRIATWVFTLPPLAERRDDIPDLIQFFIRQLIPDEKRRPLVDPLLLDYLSTRDYPGNIRELKQVVTRLVNRYPDSGWLGFGELPPCDRPVFSKIGQNPLESVHLTNALRLALANGNGHREIVNHISDTVKQLALADSAGNLQAAAERLGVSDRTMQLFVKGV